MLVTSKGMHNLRARDSPLSSPTTFQTLSILLHWRENSTFQLQCHRRQQRNHWAETPCLFSLETEPKERKPRIYQSDEQSSFPKMRNTFPKKDCYMEKLYSVRVWVLSLNFFPLLERWEQIHWDTCGTASRGAVFKSLFTYAAHRPLWLEKILPLKASERF